MSGIQYPVTLSQIHRVENQNQKISINVFTFEYNSILPLRITKHHNRLHHINLLWLNEGEKSHYCLITDFNRFLSRTKKHRAQMHFFPYCLHGFVRETLLQEHQLYCSTHDAQRVELPLEGKNDVLEFSDFEKTLKVPFVIYADFETINKKNHTCAPHPEKAANTPTTKPEVCSFGYKVVCEDPTYTKPSVIYRGTDAGYKLIECQLQEQEEIEQILRNIKPLQLTAEEQKSFDASKRCCNCNKHFSLYDKTYNRPVRHHNHFTRKYIGAACNSCNIRARATNSFVPTFFHNLSRFDAHILCENVGLFKDRHLTCIPQNTERYVSFSIGKLRFLDRLQFLPNSLENLVEDLKEQGKDSFEHLMSESETAYIDLLLRKGIYMYEYMDSFNRFNEPHLPSKEQFYSTIRKEHISEEDYEHACNVFSSFNMTCLGEYHDLYLKTDVLLLADVFESFRGLCLTQYGLDPCHCYTSPGLSCLKLTGVKLELLGDIDQVLMIEGGIRGGISQICNRYKKANNPYLEDYNSTLPNTYLMYLDANNLYGWAMMQPLPIGKFSFLDKKELMTFDVMSIPDNGDLGYILEVSLHYPEHLPDEHNDLPLAPVRKCVSYDELSPYAQNLLRKLHGLEEHDPLPKRVKVQKLLTTLEDKDYYVVHYRTLQLYITLGMEIESIHRILRFKQDTWMKSYISLNTEMRYKATSTFQKNFFKLLNNSVFGKTMENVRLHKNIELVYTGDRFKKVTAKPTYKNTTTFNEDLVAVELLRAKVKLFKPIYSGMCILDLSKHLMYDFWYNYVKRKYQSSVQLQMTDTDSLLFSCDTDDIYIYMKDNLDYFDTSEYPRDHFLHDNRNKKVPGRMKDELAANVMSEFIGLRAKMYSFTSNNQEVKRAKGVSRTTVDKDIRHEHYKNTLFNETHMISSMSALRSHKHLIFGETIQKSSLSAFDDKRFLIDQIKSYPYGHRRILNTGLDNNSNNDSEVMFTESETEDDIHITATSHVMDETATEQIRLNHDQSSFHRGYKITPCESLFAMNKELPCDKS